MRRPEKIRLIKGILSGNISAQEIKPTEVEIWLQDNTCNKFKNIKSGKFVTPDVLDEMEARKNIIRLIFVEGKKIL
jgi:hypothetical protein